MTVATSVVSPWLLQLAVPIRNALWPNGSPLTQRHTYDQLRAQSRFRQRQRWLLVAAVLAAPWLWRWVQRRLQNTALYRAHRQRHESFQRHLSQVPRPKKEQKAGVNGETIKKLSAILRIVIPGWRSRECALIVLHTVFLIARTYLSVVVASLDGRIVKDLIAANGREFLLGLVYWFAIAIPATFTNSMIRYLQSKLAISFRCRLTSHLHQVYLDNKVYYRMLNLDSRITSPDQLICTDVAKFCDALSSLYSNIAKPLLDLVIFNYQLAKNIGGSGMAGILSTYVLTAWLLRRVSPGFGNLAAVEAKLEGDFRAAHTRIITNAEEIAFYNGGNREYALVDSTYLTLIRHVNRIYRIRIFYNMFEDFIIKYSWSAVGLLVCAIPVFFPRWAGSRVRAALEQGHDEGHSHGSRTQGFITNKRLMISLADAGGRIMYAYKEMAELAGYTERVHELLTVVEDMEFHRYSKTMVTTDVTAAIRSYSLVDLRGALYDGYTGVKFDRVPVVTPSGDLLVNDMTFEIGKGQHLLITGPNGVGKSSIVRILSGLWPIFRGTVDCPDAKNIIFVPQRPYLSLGTLRDQIIYPHTVEDMLRSGRTDQELMQILETVHLEYLPTREGGWEAKKEWKDVFSGGEKQRMNLARVFYHLPRFAVLDECTSAVSSDVEGFMYARAKDLGITLITVSHRPALFKYHQLLLRLGGQEAGHWELTELGSKAAQQTVEAEIRDLETRVAEEDRLRKRIAEINALLGVKANAVKK